MKTNKKIHSINCPCEYCHCYQVNEETTFKDNRNLCDVTINQHDSDCKNDCRHCQEN